MSATSTACLLLYLALLSPCESRNCDSCAKDVVQQFAAGNIHAVKSCILNHAHSNGIGLPMPATSTDAWKALSDALVSIQDCSGQKIRPASAMDHLAGELHGLEKDKRRNGGCPSCMANVAAMWSRGDVQGVVSCMQHTGGGMTTVSLEKDDDVSEALGGVLTRSRECVKRYAKLPIMPHVEVKAASNKQPMTSHVVKRAKHLDVGEEQPMREQPAATTEEQDEEQASAKSTVDAVPMAMPVQRSGNLHAIFEREGEGCHSCTHTMYADFRQNNMGAVVKCMGHLARNLGLKITHDNMFTSLETVLDATNQCHPPTRFAPQTVQAAHQRAEIAGSEAALERLEKCAGCVANLPQMWLGGEVKAVASCLQEQQKFLSGGESTGVGNMGNVSSRAEHILNDAHACIF